EVVRRHAAGRTPRADEGLAALVGRALPQRASDPAWPARPERADADAEGILLRWRAARAAAAAALGRPARDLAAAAGERIAGHLARPFDGADRDRRRAHRHRSGMGQARVAVEPRRTEALPAGAGAAARDAAGRPGGDLARPLRPPRLSDHP